MSYHDEVRRAREKRDNQVMRLRKRGLTYAEIGERLGISRQRAHQLATRKAFQTKETTK